MEQKQTDIVKIMSESRDVLKALEPLLQADEDTVAGLLCGELDAGTAEGLQAGLDMYGDFMREQALVKSTGVPALRLLRYLPCLELLEDGRLRSLYEFYLQQKAVLKDMEAAERLADMVARRNAGGLLAAGGQNGDVSARQKNSAKMLFASEDGTVRLSLDIVAGRFEFLLEADGEARKTLENCRRLHLGTFPAVELEDGFGEMKVQNSGGDCVPVVLELDSGRTIPLKYSGMAD